jgi:hypothetical protein
MRNAIFIPEDRALSLFALVWSPGQWTPVHDRGSWGVVGVPRGVLEERSHIRTDVNAGHDDAREDGIVLERGGVLLLDQGTVTSFVPNPDHIHLAGVPPERRQAVGLHLYGRQPRPTPTRSSRSAWTALSPTCHGEADMRPRPYCRITSMPAFYLSAISRQCAVLLAPVRALKTSPPLPQARLRPPPLGRDRPPLVTTAWLRSPDPAHEPGYFGVVPRRDLPLGSGDMFWGRTGTAKPGKPD